MKFKKDKTSPCLSFYMWYYNTSRYVEQKREFRYDEYPLLEILWLISK